MRYVLARASRSALARFACSRMLLALDFDGTLAPIVRNPARARMRLSTRRVLQQLVHVYPCVVISGRAGADVRGRLRGVDVVDVIGNHGIEAWPLSERFRGVVRRWRRILGRRLARLEGVAIETKGLSLAIHYRRSPEKAKARAAIRAATRLLDAARLVPGKQVLNVLPQEAGNKGTALERARARLGCDTAVYVGDDDTDEDVFALDRPGRLLTIRVGRKRGSRAAYYLRRQAEIDALLRRLFSLRIRPRRRGVGASRQPLGLDHRLQMRARRVVPQARRTSPRRISPRAVTREARRGATRRQVDVPRIAARVRRSAKARTLQRSRMTEIKRTRVNNGAAAPDEAGAERLHR